MTLIKEFKAGSLTYQRHSFESYEELEASDLAGDDATSCLLLEDQEMIHLFSNYCVQEPNDPYQIRIYTSTYRFWRPGVRDANWGAEVIHIKRRPSIFAGEEESFADKKSRETFCAWQHRLDGYDLEDEPTNADTSLF